MNSFRKDFVSGTFYIGIAKYAGIVSQIVITAILARLLTPEDYGVIAIATVFIAFFNILSDLGIGIAVIQRKDLEENDLDHLFSINVYVGFFLGLLFFIMSGTISSFYDDPPQLKYVCQALSILILFSCARTVPTNLLYRERKFRYIAFSNLSVQIICGIAAIFAAYSGWGVYALVLSQVGSAILLFIVYTYNYHRKFHFRVNFEPLKRIFSYSVYELIGSIFVYFTQNIDKLLIGKYTGPAALGYYEKSYRLAYMPIQNITFVVTPVLHPLFSEFQNDYKQLANKYLKIINAFSYLSFPISVFFFFTAKELIQVFFGDQWGEAVPVFQITSFAVAFMMLNTTVGSIYNAAYLTKRGFYMSVFFSLFMIFSISIAIWLYNTIIAVAIAFTIARIVITFISFYALLQGLGQSYSIFLKAIAKPMLLGVVDFFILGVFVCLISFEGVLVSLIVKAIVWVIISIILAQLFSGYNIVKLALEKSRKFLFNKS